MILSLLSGYVDVVGYLLLRELFVASITGNIVKYSNTLSEGTFSTALATVSIFYGIGSGITRVIAIFYKSQPNFDNQILGCIYLMLEFVFLFCGMLAGHYLSNDINSSSSLNTSSIIGTGIILSTGMGIQAGAAQNAFQGFLFCLFYYFFLFA